MTADNTQIREAWPVPCPYCGVLLRPRRDAFNIVQVETHYCQRTPYASPAVRSNNMRILQQQVPV